LGLGLRLGRRESEAMATKHLPPWVVALADEFNRHLRRADGEQVAGSLVLGLSVARDLLYYRVHQEVESVVGRDSMLMPVSEAKSRIRTEAEIAVYQAAEAAGAVRSYRYAGGDGDWPVRWMARLALDDRGVEPSTWERVDRYLRLDPRARQLAFADELARILPESRQAPLVLFRLVPMAVQIVVAAAFSDRKEAERLRAGQKAEVPGIAGCPQCQGKVLDNGQSCAKCGNPVWKYQWLTEAE
jgi:hypothetical protein